MLMAIVILILYLDFKFLIYFLYFPKAFLAAST